MNRNKSDDLNLKRAIRGINLTEAIENSQIRPAELLRRAKAQSNTYFNMSPQTLSQIMHGKRTLQYEDAVIFADILGVNANDLMGRESTKMKVLSSYEKAAEKYELLLNQTDARILSYVFDDNDTDMNTLKGYIVAYNMQSDQAALTSEFETITVSSEEMKAFYQDVCRFIRKRFDIMKDLSTEEI